MKNPTFATRWNADVIDDKYKLWLDHPDQLDDHWRAFFEGFELARSLGPDLAELASSEVAPAAQSASEGLDPRKQARLVGAIYAYRSIGHTEARVNPLSREIMPNPRLTLERLGLEEADLDVVTDTGNYLGGVNMRVRELLDRLRQTYCGSVGVEYIHIQETSRRRWIQARIEPGCFRPDFPRERQIRMYERLATAEIFERFLHSKFVGQKRFSLEGGETLITAIDAVIQRFPRLGIREMVMGMAHRGRLNVLANVVGKSLEYIFREFAEDFVPEGIMGDGDVKYHLGYENTTTCDDGSEIEIRLAANPSHLEAVNSVVQGKARARQRIIGDLERTQVLPLLVHGDAAFAGQGVVAEVLNFSKLKGYRTGGTVHLIVNNQIGFTTDPTDARSSLYCTDVAKMIESPIFHVNGNDALAVANVAEIAIDYRNTFQEDVFIDIIGYRKHGHNEADEPAFTQPILYRRINDTPSPREAFARDIIRRGILTEEEVNALDESIRLRMEEAYERSRDRNSKPQSSSPSIYHESSAVFQPEYDFKTIETRVSKTLLADVAKVLTTLPGQFDANPKIARQFKAKAKAFQEDTGIDWAFGEALAFGTLMKEGNPVRLSGQDSERGTFSQRHAAIYDMQTRERYVPLNNLGEDAAQFCVHNSLLSEAAVLGFDYGYSLEYPDMLSLWEAQFGDFSNGAQVVIDQFLISSESKWRRISGIVLLLPHGYEGQGPEHSSARPERFLQNCAENNIQVCNLTTPAQYFHVLRRQMRRKFSKPLVILSPKSLLRHKLCVSPKSAFTDEDFSSILDDTKDFKDATTVILCSGKVYYDLLERRTADDIRNAALIRLEQYYPLNEKLLVETLKSYRKAKRFVWCQEEPANMGAWSFLRPRLERCFGQPFEYAGRDEAASPATGFASRHKAEQRALVEAALGIER